MPRTTIELLEAAQSGHAVDLRDLDPARTSPVQLGSLIASLWHHDRLGSTPMNPVLAGLGLETDPETILSGSLGNKWWPVINAVRVRRAPSLESLSFSLANLEQETPVEMLLSGVFLSLCLLKYFPQPAIDTLTEAIIGGGRTYDYRPVFEREGFKLVRRYPTGGLSEKCALLLPAMIECFGVEFGIKSPFSVGRTLGFTGGTWDKLSSIEGFRFPAPGEEVIDILRRGHCAITVTLGDAAPADRVLYLRRSETSTIESDALIVSSIASKHSAIPVHHMVLDTRIGSGAFMKDVETAERISRLIENTLRARGIDVLPSILENAQPNGSAIGNYLEILEANEILRGNHSGEFDLRGKKDQLAICSDFFVKMIMMARPDRYSDVLPAKIDASIASGDLWSAQKRFLVNHSVCSEVVEALENDPWLLMNGIGRKDIRSRGRGYVRDIRQRALGRKVYGDLAGSDGDRRRGGVILKKRRYDPVAEGDLIFSVFGASNQDTSDELLIQELFDLRPF